MRFSKALRNKLDHSENAERGEATVHTRTPRKSLPARAGIKVVLGPLSSVLEAQVLELTALLGVEDLARAESWAELAALAAREKIVALVPPSPGYLPQESSPAFHFARESPGASDTFPVSSQLEGATLIGLASGPVAPDTLEAGRRDVLFLPSEASTFLSRLDQALFPLSAARIYHFSSAHGGAACTSTALTLAYELAGTEESLYLDFSGHALGLGALGLEIPPEAELAELAGFTPGNSLLAGQLRRRAGRLPGRSRLHVLSGSTELPRCTRVAILAASARAFKHVVVDWGSTRPELLPATPAGLSQAWALTCSSSRFALAAQFFPSLPKEATAQTPSPLQLPTPDYVFWRGFKRGRIKTPHSLLPRSPAWAAAWSAKLGPPLRHRRAVRRFAQILEVPPPTPS